MDRLRGRVRFEQRLNALLRISEGSQLRYKVEVIIEASWPQLRISIKSLDVGQQSSTSGSGTVFAWPVVSSQQTTAVQVTLSMFLSGHEAISGPSTLEPLQVSFMVFPTAFSPLQLIKVTCCSDRDNNKNPGTHYIIESSISRLVSIHFIKLHR